MGTFALLLYSSLHCTNIVVVTVDRHRFHTQRTPATPFGYSVTVLHSFFPFLFTLYSEDGLVPSKIAKTKQIKR